MKYVKYLILVSVVTFFQLQAQMVRETSLFPPEMSSLGTSTIPLGGSTGAYRVEYNGIPFVEKAGKTIGHILNEYYTNKAYEVLGVPVPEVRLYWHDDRLYMLSTFISGITLDRFLESATPKKKSEMFKKLQEHFVADALLANWDVIGLNFDNIVIDKQNRPWRVDNGSGLMYRAQGALKGRAWSPQVTEIDTMRDEDRNYSAGTVFGSIKRAEIERQVTEILKKRQALLNVFPEDYRSIMQGRLEYLERHYASN